MSKQIFQLLLAIFGLIAIVTGLWGMITGALDKEYYVDFSNKHQILDSNLRYFSGLWLGTGISLFYIIPKIEIHKTTFRLICMSIFIGGLGRIISLLYIGTSPRIFVFFAVLELLFPILIIYQNKIANK